MNWHSFAIYSSDPEARLLLANVQRSSLRHWIATRMWRLASHAAKEGAPVVPILPGPRPRSLPGRRDRPLPGNPGPEEPGLSPWRDRVPIRTSSPSSPWASTSAWPGREARDHARKPQGDPYRLERGFIKAESCGGDWSSWLRGRLPPARQTGYGRQDSSCVTATSFT